MKYSPTIIRTCHKITKVFVSGAPSETVASITVMVGPKFIFGHCAQTVDMTVQTVDVAFIFSLSPDFNSEERYDATEDESRKLVLSNLLLSRNSINLENMKYREISIFLSSWSSTKRSTKSSLSIKSRSFL